MFTTNTAFQIRTDGTAFFRCHTNQLSHTILVENLERVYFQNLLFQKYKKSTSTVMKRKKKTTFTAENTDNYGNR